MVRARLLNLILYRNTSGVHLTSLVILVEPGLTRFRMLTSLNRFLNITIYSRVNLIRCGLACCRGE